MKNKHIWLLTLLILTLAYQSPYASMLSDKAHSYRDKAQQKQLQSFKLIVVDFWDKKFPAYHMHKTLRDLINNIDDIEMLAYLVKKGVKPTKETLVTSDNLIAYLRHKKLGTEAIYAWLDLYKGSPEFIKAVLDWQAIRKENGFEFLPTYYLLSKAKLKTKKDSEAWTDIFKATFGALKSQDQDSKTLMLWCLMPRIWGDRKFIELSTSKRFVFLEEEFKKQKDILSLYSQALIFNLYGANFVSSQYKRAADFGKLLKPQKSAICFTFLAHALSKDLPAAKAVLSEMELMSPRDEEMIKTCTETIKELEQMAKKSNKPMQETP